MENFVSLVVLSSSSRISSASTSRPKDQSESSGESEASTDPMTTRRAKHACGKPMQTNPDKPREAVVQHTQKSRWMKRIQRKAFLNLLQLFIETQEDLETHVPAHPSEREISDSEGDASKVETQKRKHSIYTHFPKDRNFDICSRTQNTRVPCRTRNDGSFPLAESFGDLITADHKVFNEGSESQNNHGYAVVVQDPATQWIQSYACKNKNSLETEKSPRTFLEPSQEPKVIYTGNSWEFGKSCEELSWNHRASTPYRTETNGIAEKAGRRVKEGTSTVLLHSGVDDKWWSDSMECYCYLRKVQPPTFRERDKARFHQFGKKVLPGIFLGYALIAVRIWKGDILVPDIEHLEKLDASEIYPRRLNAKEVKIYISCGRWFSNIKTKRLNGGKCPMLLTNHAVGIGTCIQGMTIPSYLSSEMHLQKVPWPNTISELNSEYPSRSLRKGS